MTRLELLDPLSEPLDLEAVRGLLPARPVIVCDDPGIGEWDEVRGSARVAAPATPHTFWTVSTTSHIDMLALPDSCGPIALCLTAGLLEDDTGCQVHSTLHAYLAHRSIDYWDISGLMARRRQFEELGLIELTANTPAALASQARDLAASHQELLTKELTASRVGPEQAVFSNVAPARPKRNMFVVDGVDIEAPRAPWPIVEWELEALEVGERSAVWWVTPPDAEEPERWVTFLRIRSDMEFDLDGVVRLESFARPDARFDAAVATCLLRGRSGLLPHQRLSAWSLGELQAQLLR